MRTLRIVIILFLLGLAGPAAAQQARSAQPAVQVAVFPLSGLMLGAGAEGAQLAETFRNMIITELGQAGRLRLVERQTVDSLLQAQAIATSGMVSDAQAIQVGQLLGAQYAVTGGITIDRNNARLDLRLVDIETGEVTTPFKDMVRRDDLLTLVDRVATEFAGKVDLRPRAVAVEVPAAAALAFSRGLDFERRGMKKEAATMFRRTLELFPQHPHAQEALRRVN